MTDTPADAPVEAPQDHWTIRNGKGEVVASAYGPAGGPMPVGIGAIAENLRERGLLVE